MFEQNTHLVSLGLGDFGSGISSVKSWVVAFVGLLVLALLAWWTTRPARRAARPQLPASPPEITSAPRTRPGSHSGHRPVGEAPRHPQRLPPG